MRSIARKHSLTNSVENQKADWRQQFAGSRWTDQGEITSRQMKRSPLQQKSDGQRMPAELCIEDIEVYADRKHMYCKGNVRSLGARTRSNLVVAVEWLDENQQALNTDWKRIEMQLDGKQVPLIPNTRRPFIVKAPLDRRVKWVNAYAFSSNN
jgi:hypothetical protein